MSGIYLQIYFVVNFLLFFVETVHEGKCGRPLETKFIMQSDRVVAGYDVGYYKYPWFAALIQKKQVSCGGALIGPKTVLTAAHCYKEYLELARTSDLKLENVYTVRLGMYNICTTENTTTEYKVQKVQVHELYPTKKPYFDICLLTLANSTDLYDPICLPSGVITTRPKDGIVPGMGTLKYQGAMPCTLHEARILIYPDSTCHNMINNTGNNASEIKNAFCAGYLTGGIDTCQGDSGGPLQVMDENGRYVLFGIVSFGFHCAVPGFLGIYTDVSRYISWIKEKSQTDMEFISSVINNSEETASTSNDFIVPKKTKKPVHHQHYHAAPIHIIILRNNEHNNRRSHQGKSRRHMNPQ